MRVKDVMCKFNDIAVTSPNTIFKDTLIKMTEKPLGCICIIEENRKLIGILTDGDIRRVLQRFDNVLNIEISNVMTVNPITIHENAPLVEALALMENRINQISVLPVVENEVIIGLIRIHDIIGKQ
ncbi:Arabinose 5-phosphate isomerase KdsD [bioreactor metagenome]|uniref:Arabinose 5-phosphate isomerase KdsD n=1 Tax=bioreactor metagenome TaxID=1076179 RepID=A0A645IAN9_9ZZZZ